MEGASEAELRAWDMHQLECMRQLGQWKVENPLEPLVEHQHGCGD